MGGILELGAIESLSVSLIVKESATKQHGKCSLIVRNQRKQVLCGLFINDGIGEHNRSSLALL
jgi:hypothetical protein